MKDKYCLKAISTIDGEKPMHRFGELMESFAEFRGVLPFTMVFPCPGVRIFLR